MSPELLIFDRNLLLKRRSNIANSLTKADFLIKHSLNDILERLDGMSKEFPIILNLGSHNCYDSNELLNRLGTHTLINTSSVTPIFKCNPKNGNIANKYSLIVDEENLSFADNQFDLIISILNLHLINDLPGCLIQLKNSLKPGGVLIASLFGERNLNELRAALIKTELECFGGISPRMIPTIELKQLGGLLQRAGFSMPIVDKDTLEVHYSSPIKLLHDLRNMSETNILLDRNKKYLGKEFWLKFNNNYIADYSYDQNSVIATFEILNITAVK